ncbi:cysteine proteinase [Dictyostelium discoideum AX4]|uniref:Cysteine proteinase 6 n=1 Tax=Dictyostelium discoideum TaxID=44689 RepID=CYSP6_DICDI|nr:cysteine proteinase [Dictyostelium discoideum AX4]Q94503.1 RecName: Full=Cysteine proteinase 6; Flags: Precursor [Dictyostelium discoideum]AAC47481.1 cysteine proteinase [Dictyostelium discoideum]EAL67741.1 cysteine proteinase [Dictyostelium discoideum AX4]|eukprot:XP_641725.1 cysteine proteinase [Dictyostelium discoideum AX4]
MKVLSALCVLLVSVATAKQQLSELQYRNAFTNWMIAHQRHYSSEEFNGRFNIFKANMDYINEWNTKGSETVLGLNVFADITNEEYRATYLGTPFDASSLEMTPSEKVFGGVQANSVDWRAKGAVTPIKNQGECGGCWSFSATGATEGAQYIANGDSDLTSVSEQQLIDCSGSYGNNGCEGGLMTLAFEYIINNGGIDTESSYPFTANTEKCKYNPSNIGAELSSYVNVTSGSESDLAAKVTQGPTSVAIDASQPSFQFYSSGIYNEPACSSTQLDHGVLAVGFGSGSSGSQSQSAGSQSQSSNNNWSESSQSQDSNSWSQSSQSQSSQDSNSWSQSSQSQGSNSFTGAGTGSGSGSVSGSGSASGSSSFSGSSNGGNSNSGDYPTDGNYWIVKNSWGLDWGINGYILMSKDKDNQCGIATMASIPQAIPKSKWN